MCYAVNQKLFEAELDSTRDRFQVGRLDSSGCNDLVLCPPSGEPCTAPATTPNSRGKKFKPFYRNGRFVYPPLPATDSVPAGGMGRFAFRIECERDAPHRCYIYASGYDEDNVSLIIVIPLCT